MDSCESTENPWHVENSTKTMTEEKKGKAKEIVKAVAVAAGVGLAVAAGAGLGLALWGISKILGVSKKSSDRKMMKEPGSNYYIFRGEFERDPASYFRSLRE